jgi:dihydroorotase
MVEKIGANLTSDNALVVQEKGLHVCPGLFDMNVDFSEPGNEHKETLLTGCNAAMHGGFTGVSLDANSLPARDNNSSIEFCIHKTKEHLVDVHPMGSITKSRKGKELSEMYDMKLSGAVAFYDGKEPIENAGVFSRALLYAKNFNGLILSFPYDKSISSNGQMHEGVESTKLGLQGMPSLSEELQLSRDLFLTSYNDAKIHFSNISCGTSIPILMEAKGSKLNVSAGVAIHNLILTDENLADFDSNFKVTPPLRSKDDNNALIKGLKSGVLDVITSDHSPQDTESKIMEFGLAEFGMIGTQTAFPLAVTHLSKTLGLEKIITSMSINPRTILQLEVPIIKKGFKANITLFNPTKNWTFTHENNQSISENSPFFNTVLNCKVVGTINGSKVFMNE